MYIETGYGSFF